MVIPCHNYGRFLREAMDSVVSQTRPPDEIVIVDDGSSDETPQIVSELCDRQPALITIRRSPAVGPARTFNDAVRASTGGLVVILSADDRLSPNYLELMEGAFHDPSVAFAYSGTHLFGSANEMIPPKPFDARKLMRVNWINGSAMFRRSMFDLVDGFRTDLDAIGLEDWEFWLRAVGRGARGQPVEGCWLDYRRHPEGSRNAISYRRHIRALLRVRRLNPDVVGVRDLAGSLAALAVHAIHGLITRNRAGRR